MKKFIVILLSLIISITPSLTFASAAEKWEILENNYDHTKNTVNVTAKKITQQAANSGVYKVQVPVNSATLGSTLKMMLKGGAAVAAITALVNGVGWVIDEGSKLIKKPKQNQDQSIYQYLWNTGGWSQSIAESASSSGKKFADAYCKAYGHGTCTATLGNLINIDTVEVIVKRENGSSVGTFHANRYKNPNYDPAKPLEYDIVSDFELGNEALGKGKEPKSNPQPQPALIADAYSPNNPVSDAPAPKATNDALNNANPQPEKEPEGKSETEKEKDENGEETGKETSKFELPNFCEWAPSVCAFFTVQKQDNKDIKENQKLDTEQNKTFFQKVTDFFSFITGNFEEPEIDKPLLPMKELDVKEINKDLIRINSNNCPADISVNWDGLPFGIVINESIQMQPYCEKLEPLKYVFQMITFVLCVMILARI